MLTRRDPQVVDPARKKAFERSSRLRVRGPTVPVVPLHPGLPFVATRGADVDAQVVVGNLEGDHATRNRLQVQLEGHVVRDHERTLDRLVALELRAKPIVPFGYELQVRAVDVHGNDPEVHPLVGVLLKPGHPSIGRVDAHRDLHRHDTLVVLDGDRPIARDPRGVGSEPDDHGSAGGDRQHQIEARLQRFQPVGAAVPQVRGLAVRVVRHVHHVDARREVVEGEGLPDFQPADSSGAGRLLDELVLDRSAVVRVLGLETPGEDDGGLQLEVQAGRRLEHVQLALESCVQVGGHEQAMGSGQQAAEREPSASFADERGGEVLSVLVQPKNDFATLGSLDVAGDAQCAGLHEVVLDVPGELGDERPGLTQHRELLQADPDLPGGQVLDRVAPLGVRAHGAKDAWRIRRLHLRAHVDSPDRPTLAVAHDAEHAVRSRRFGAGGSSGVAQRAHELERLRVGSRFGGRHGRSSGVGRRRGDFDERFFSLGGVGAFGPRRGGLALAAAVEIEVRDHPQHHEDDQQRARSHRRGQFGVGTSTRGSWPRRTELSE